MRQGRTGWGYGVLLLIVGCLWSVLGCSNTGRSEPEDSPAPIAPTARELGLRLAPRGLNMQGLSASALEQVARGSYLVNGVGGGCGCHTSAAGYLAGGQEFPLPFADVQGLTSVIARNLTPDPSTGMELSEAEFIEAMRTGKDFYDSTATHPQSLLVMPWAAYRFLALDDLQAIYAFLRRIPPIRHAVRETFVPPFPAPPLPAPALMDTPVEDDPEHSARGLLLPSVLSTGAAADAFAAQIAAVVARLRPAEQQQVGRGSYLMNAIAACGDCHTSGDGSEHFSGPFLPGTVDINTAAYLAGGVDIGRLVGLGRLLARNLTPEPGTGLLLSEEQFVQTLQFGADFRRPGGSLRVLPHFPTEYHMTLDDLQAMYAYLRVIPPVVRSIALLP